MFDKSEIEQYFIAEKNAGLFFLIAGIVAIVVAIAIFIFLKSNLYKGLAWTLIVLGLLQAIVGYTIYSRSDKQRTDTVYAFDMNPVKLKTVELPRTQKVVKSITVFLWLELLTFIIGIILIWAQRRFLTGSSLSAAPVWLGVGFVLVFQSILMAAADFSAYRRSAKYAQQLENFIPKN